MGKIKGKTRITCKICGGEFDGYVKSKYCGDKCKRVYCNRRQNEYYQKRVLKQRGEFIKCLICGRFYKQVGSHIVQIHKITAREYRKEYGLDVKKGRLAQDLHEKKARQAFECGGIKNLKIGKKFWFEKGDKRAGKYERSDETMERLHNMNKGLTLIPKDYCGK